MDKRIVQVLINKAGGTAGKTSVTHRVSLPNAWMNELGINKEDRKVKMTFDGKKIVIEKLDAEEI